MGYRHLLVCLIGLVTLAGCQQEVVRTRPGSASGMGTGSWSADDARLGNRAEVESTFSLTGSPEAPHENDPLGATGTGMETFFNDVGGFFSGPESEDAAREP